MTTLNTETHPIFKQMRAKAPLTLGTVNITVAIPRRLYLDLYLGWEHDHAVVAGTYLRMDTCMHLRDLLPQLKDDHPDARTYRQQWDIYNGYVSEDLRWLESKTPATKGVLHFSIPVPKELLSAGLKNWDHWVLVELGRYMEQCILHNVDALTDTGVDGIQKEWEATYPDCV